MVTSKKGLAITIFIIGIFLILIIAGGFFTYKYFSTEKAEKEIF